MFTQETQSVFERFLGEHYFICLFLVFEETWEKLQRHVSFYGGMGTGGGGAVFACWWIFAVSFCFFRLYALPSGMVRVAGVRVPQVERCAEE